MEYIKQEDLKDFHFLQVPRVIWKAKIKGQLNDLAFMIYVEFFDRLKVSAINNWIDKEGNVYIKYSYEELMDILELKSKGSIAKGIKCLLEYDLIKQKKGFNTSSIFYLSNILKLTEVHKREHSSTQMETQKYTNVDANYNNCNYNNPINNNLITSSLSKLPSAKYLNYKEFINSFKILRPSQIDVLIDYYNYFVDKYKTNHFKLTEEEIENITIKVDEYIRLTEQLGQDKHKIRDAYMNFFFNNGTTHSIHRFFNHSTILYSLTQLGILGSESFDSDGSIKTDYSEDIV